MEHKDTLTDESNLGAACFVSGNDEAAVTIAQLDKKTAMSSNMPSLLRKPRNIEACGFFGETVNAVHEFQTIKACVGQKAFQTGVRNNTYNRLGLSTEIPQSELLKMLYYLEGELQARDVVIAALRNERVKHLISQLRTKRIQPNDPYAAIFRDKIALNGNFISRDTSTKAAQAEMEVRQIIEQQMEQQYQMVTKQRATHVRMVKILTDSLESNQRMLTELETEKHKNDNGTDQSNNKTYKLEMERTKLMKELEQESIKVQKLEKDLKVLQETLDFERNRQKQIVLLLIAERKKILMKYIEEGKRSEDLAQILAEEKQRSDAIAEGLEEESKKSLRMEEELEKQTLAMTHERKILLCNLAKEELRVKDLEQELTTLRCENEALKKQQLILPQSSSFVSATCLSAIKGRNLSDETCAITTVANISKIVQPTATVSSVPVTGPTTGIARSITPGQNIRNVVSTVGMTSAPAVTTTTIANNYDSGIVVTGVNNAKAGTGLPSTPVHSPAKNQSTTTIQRASGGKFVTLTAAITHDHQATVLHSHPIPIAVPPASVPPTSARGVPPPIPTKPIVPPKREPSLSRLNAIASGGAVTSTSVSAVVASNIVATTSTAAQVLNANLKHN